MRHVPILNFLLFQSSYLLRYATYKMFILASFCFVAGSVYSRCKLCGCLRRQTLESRVVDSPLRHSVAAMPHLRGQELPCDARIADGVFRGGALGLLWSVWFGPSECWSTERPFRQNALQLTQRTGMYVLGFGGFLACYNGIFCCCERSFGRDSAASPVAAGGLVGLAVGAMIPPLRVVTMLSTSGMCAGLCGAGHAMGVVWRTDSEGMAPRSPPTRTAPRTRSQPKRRSPASWK